MIYVLPYKKASKSARELANAMNVPLLGVDVDLKKGGDHITIINWGSGVISNPEILKCKIINKPECVLKAVNKIATFEAFTNHGEVPFPEWTRNRLEACKWSLEGSRVFCRTEVEGRDGSGLVVCEPGTMPVEALLYTKHINAVAEYRVNTTTEKCVGVQKKVPTVGASVTSSIVKTGGNGYGFHLLSESEIPKGIRPCAKDALKALGLEFGGVDIIVTNTGAAYVLEVNTAPELTPSMISGYANLLKAM